eukprot:INCI10727.2.p1 GENE.INCI10727.2~~INCI10727.2.p1  ORF type:complete len:110 (-),score=6.70 INCI10727.2:8-337(-)
MCAPCTNVLFSSRISLARRASQAATGPSFRLVSRNESTTIQAAGVAPYPFQVRSPHVAQVEERFLQPPGQAGGGRPDSEQKLFVISFETWHSQQRARGMRFRVGITQPM